MAITASQLNVKIAVDGAARAKSDIASVGDAVDRSESSRRALGAGFLGMSGLIGGVFIGGTQQAITFGEQMANVNSIAQLSTAELDKVGDSVLGLATKTGQGPQVLAQGLYDIYSSGFQGAEGLQVLEASAYAANAGLTTTAVSAKGVTAVLNAYGLGAEDAARVSDIMFQTVNDGVITFEQLSANMGNTLPMANALGVSFEELAAGYAQMTLSGVPAAQVETQLASLMRSALNPTEAMTAAVQDYGYASVESLIATEGFTGYLDVLTKASGGSNEELFNLLGTQEAVNAALLLGGDNAAEYAAQVDRMEASSEGMGATQKALAKQMESTAFSLRLLKTNVKAAAIAIGVQLEPGIRIVAKALTAAIKVFLDLPKPIQRIIAGFTALAGVLALVAGGIILFGPQLAAIGALFLGMLGPIALVVAAIAGLYLAWQTNFLGIRDIVADVAGAVLGFLEPVLDFVGRFKAAWDDLGSTDLGQFADQWAGLSIGNDIGLVERAVTALDIATGGLVTRLREMTAIDLAGWAAGAVVSFGNWTLDVAIPAIADFSWDIGGLILGKLGDITVSLTDWVAQLDGAKVADGTLDLAGDIKDWIVGNPIAAIAIPASLLTLAFFGAPAILFGGILGGLALLITMAIIGDIPDEVALNAADLAIALSGFSVEIEEFGAEVMVEVGLQAAFIEEDWNAFWAVFSLSDVTIALPSIDIDWGPLGAIPEGIEAMFGPGSRIDSAINGAVRGLAFSAGKMGEGFMNLFGPGSPLDNAIDGAFSGLADIAGEAAAPFIDSLSATWDEITSALENVPDIDIPMPNINWPSVDDLAGTAPANLLEFLADPIAYILGQSGGTSGGGVDFGLTGMQLALEGTILQLTTAQALMDKLKGTPQPDIDPSDNFGAWRELDALVMNTSGSIGTLSATPVTIDTTSAVANLDALKNAVAGIGGGMGRDALGGGGQGGAAAPGGGSGGMFAGLTAGINAAIVTVSTGITTIQAVVSASMAGITMAVTLGMAMVRTAFATGMNAGIVAVATGMTTMRAVVAAQMAGITAAIVSGMATARSATVAGAAAMSASMIAGMAAFRAAVTSGMASAVAAVRSGVAQMVSAASAGRGAMAAAGQGIGAALGQGIAAGIRGQIGAVAAAAAALVSAAIGAARSAGAISSPSKIMHDQIGLMLGLGVERGILDSLGGINRAAERMVPSLAGATGLGTTVPYVPMGARGGGNTTITVNAPLNINAPIYGVDDLDERLARHTDDITAAIQRNRVASGVMS